MRRKKNVVIVGNCQASAIAALYRDFVGNPNFEAVTYFNDHDIPLEVTRAAVAEADLVIVQDRDFNHGLTPEQLPAGIEVQPFPMVLAGFVWPFANEPHVSNVPEPPFSDGPYPSQLSDSFLNRLIVRGATPEEAMEEYLALDIARAAHLDRMSQIYFDRQRERDRRSGFDLARVIEARFQSEALFRTPHHPNAPLFSIVATQLFERLSVPTEVIRAACDSLITTPFPPDELPIHPGVIRHFGLSFADENTRYSYFDEGRFTFAEYVHRYMRYENNHALRLGIAMAAEGDVGEVFRLLEQGLERSPESMRGWRARGLVLDRMGRHRKACESFRHAVAVDPASPEGEIALSISHRYAGELDDALAAAQRAVATAPLYASANRVLAEAQYALHDHAAVATAREAARLLPSISNLHLLGLTTRAAGDLALAESAARDLLAMDPTSADVHNLLAEVLEDRGRRAEAIIVLRDGAAAGVENAQTYSLLGNFYLRDGDLAAAEATFEKGIGLEPERADLVVCRDQIRVQRAKQAHVGERQNEVGSAAASALIQTQAAVAAPPAAAQTPPPRPQQRRLRWLPTIENWPARIGGIERLHPGEEGAWSALMGLAQHDLDFTRVQRLDTSLRRLFGEAPPAGLPTSPVRLAVLGSSTTDHLLPAIRVAGLRRGLWIQCYQPSYGQFRQELLDPASDLHAFAPTAVLFALDAHHLLRSADSALDAAASDVMLSEVVDDLAALWSMAKHAFRAQVLQHTALPVAPELMGSNEHRLPGSPAAMTARFNERVAAAADAAGVDLVALDRWAARDGLKAWYDPVLWYRAKQEVTPSASPLYGDIVARVLTAGQGRSAKCLVLDLDNTVWGGVIGDDGLEGIVIGHGSALGEAFVAFQSYAKALTRRGVLLAACSKNDEANALAAFNEHPDMVLKRADFSAFVANWDDKASNLREIARQLNIGLDALVFADDNPFERNLVRSELPEVTVPELPEDPAFFASVLSEAGYFEGLALTAEDRERTAMYRANTARQVAEHGATDLQAYLRSLDMQLLWRPVDRASVKRVVQLINKTNQFNLTTRRYAEQDVEALVSDPTTLALQFRLIDRFGDNGIVAVAIGRQDGEASLEIDSWLMSCRVLGRGVERGTLSVLAGEARRRGVRELVGVYRVTAKNGMVADHYPRLGFETLNEQDGTIRYRLAIDAVDIANDDTLLTIRREDDD